MSSIAIRTEALSKKFAIGVSSARYRTVRESIKSLFSRQAARDSASQEIWALRDVSLEVGRGQTIGLIGPNGAGKSTLLKILSRITEPTTGRAEIRGRVGSLLEVGTGFHPELTGRENVYFNGALLGMKKEEIGRRFDEIAAFAGTERFLDTAVKHYSTGMHTRLAFAVAAHLETDILLVDEVLAVGDAAFQKKCLGRMNQVAKDGRTVVFVSHDLTNVAVLCESAVLLDHGTVQAVGPAKGVIELYLNRQGCGEREVRWRANQGPGGETVRMTAIRAAAADGTMRPLSIGDEVAITLEYTVHKLARLNPALVIKNAWGVTVFSTANYADPEWGRSTQEPGSYVARCTVPGSLLNTGTYYVDAMLVKDTRHVAARAHQVVAIELHDEGSLRGDYLGDWVGVVRPHCEWETSRVQAAEFVEA